MKLLGSVGGKALAPAAVLGHSRNALLRVWLSGVPLSIKECRVGPGGAPGSALPLPPPGSTLPARGQPVLPAAGLSYTSKSDPLPCSALSGKKHFAGAALPPDRPRVLPRSQGSDSDWLLPAIHHIANIIGEKKKDKIKEYVKELCQDYPDIRYVKWQVPELLSSILKSTSSPQALAKPFIFSSLLVATRQRSRCQQQGVSHLSFPSLWLYPFSFFTCLLGLIVHTSYLKSLFILE